MQQRIRIVTVAHPGVTVITRVPTVQNWHPIIKVAFDLGEPLICGYILVNT